MHRVVNLARYKIDVKFLSSLQKKRLGDRELELLVLCGTQIFDHLSGAVDGNDKLEAKNADCHIRTGQH